MQFYNRSGQNIDGMREQGQLEEIAVYNERSLSTLARAITLSEGHFALILVRCNYEMCKQQMWQRLQTLTKISLRSLVLPPSIKSLLSSVFTGCPGDQTSAIVVFGLESIATIEQVLISTNQVRDEFRKNLAVPLVLWVTDELLQKLTRFAPDFKSWAATSIKFELATHQLLALWQQTTDELFATLLDSDIGEFLPNDVLNLAPGGRRRQEIASALKDLHGRHVSLEPTIIATWKFILGRDAFSCDRIDVALEHYQQSLSSFWQQKVSLNQKTTYNNIRAELETRENWKNHHTQDINSRKFGDIGASAKPFWEFPYSLLSLSSSSYSLERVGVILYHIALCYCRQAKLQPSQSHRQWEQARDTFTVSIEVFTVAGRSDWVAQLTLQLGEVLQELQQWAELQALALQSLAQPQTQNHPVRLAQSYGFLAAVALAQSDWEDTKALALNALDILEQCQPPQLQYQGLYLLLFAKAQRQLGKSTSAIASLEKALRVEGSLQNPVQQHPKLYIDILEELRSLYIQQQQYLRAFELKQEQRAIEQQYRFCTFLGAAPLQPRQQGWRTSPLEIVASGRQPDVNRLIERLSRNDHKLTILYGPSGVGKSSLINAGLIPALETRIIAARETMPIVQTVYRDWVGELKRRLSEALARVEQSPFDRLPISEPSAHLSYKLSSETVPLHLTDSLLERVNTSSMPCENIDTFNLSTTSQTSRSSVVYNTQSPASSQTIQTILDQLRLAAEQNLLTVLIFDQFEEFFFVCTDPEQRCQFYDFLGECLDLPFLKVILSLREDYLHYLLECERCSNLYAINNNILDRQLRYYLGDLGADDAKNVICALAAVSQVQLEDSLIEALVQDLAGRSGTVRLIELQVVGAQLQAEKITTLEQYRALGHDPKASLVERSLLNVIHDCGSENEETVWQILFSLTEEKGTRPLKTQAEIASHVSALWGQRLIVSTHAEEQQATEQLELILKILVGSGLVFRVPEEPQDRYQLVHDYLVAPIRQQYRQLSQRYMMAQLEKREMELLRVRRQRLRAIAVGVTMALLAIMAGALEWRAEVQKQRAETLSINAQLSAISASSEALFASHHEFDALLEGLRASRQLKDLETQSQAGRWKFILPFLADSQRKLQRSQSASLPVKPDTRLQVITALAQAVHSTPERNRLEGHSDVIWSVTASPDGQLIASASRDQTVKLWRPNGALVATLKGHTDSVTSVAFSPDSQLIASASWDGTVRLWHRDGTVRGTLHGDASPIYTVSFSPDGKLIAAAGSDRTIRLWTVNGQLIRTLHGHQGGVLSVSFSPDGQMIASSSEDKTIKLWNIHGKLLQTITGHTGKVNSVVFSPVPPHPSTSSELAVDPVLASASDDKTVKLWSTSGQLLKTFGPHDRWVFGVAFSPDGQQIASASGDSTIRLWHRNGDLLKTFKGHSDIVTSVSFSPTPKSNHELPVVRGQETTTNQLILVSASFDKTIKLWSLDNPYNVILQGHQSEVKDVSVSPDNTLIATASNDNTVKLWNRDGKLLNTLRGHNDKVWSVSFSPDSQRIASGSRDGTVKLWNRYGILLKTLTGHRDGVAAISFSSDSRRIATGSRDGTVKLWNDQGSLIKTLTGHDARVRAVSFSGDGQLLATASDDNTVKLWTADGTLLKTLLGHSNWILDVSFSPDSQILASASYDNTVKLWTREGTLLKTLKGHADSVARVRFSPDGQILATTSWDNRVQLWRLDDTLIKTLEGHSSRVTSINWSNDGKALVSGSEDKTAIVWNLDVDDLLDKSCNWLRDYLQNNPNVRPSDRQLCQPVKVLKSTRK